MGRKSKKQIEAERLSQAVDDEIYGNEPYDSTVDDDDDDDGGGGTGFDGRNEIDLAIEQSGQSRSGHAMDPLTKDIFLALLANPNINRGHAIDDPTIIKTASRLRQALVDAKLAVPAIDVLKN